MRQYLINSRKVVKYVYMVINKGKNINKDKQKLSDKEFFDNMFPARKRNRDLMKLLVTSPSFQTIVKDTRKFLKLPENGLGPNNDKLAEKWTNEMDKISGEIMDKKSFRYQRSKIYEKVEKGEISEAMAKKQIKLLYNKITWNYLSNSIGFIIENFHLPYHFRNSIRTYIISGEFTFPPSNYTVGPCPADTEFKSGMPYFPITIYAKMTDKEYKQLKKDIDTNRLARKLPKYSEIKDIDKQIEIDEWNRHKERYDALEMKNYKMTAKEISENVLNDPNRRQKIYDNARGLERLRKKRFGNQ